jgi:adenylate cyclase
MDKKNYHRKLTAILSADVKGYSRLMGDDEERTIETLTSYRKIMTNLILNNRGRVVDSPGDNLLAEFASVVDAVSCAVDVQKELALKNAELPDSRKMEFRIGINLGDVIEDEGRIYGDGVNIAARLEGLADGGGICISGTVYDQVKNKLPLNYSYLGDRNVKNIEDPVRVYGIDLTSLTKDGSKEITDVQKDFTNRPAIAVLPFENMSQDLDQEYFADGLAEDLITRLSRWRMFPVIARNSTFVYKGQAVDVTKVSKELNARYIIEGSVRRAGKRVRVTAQLIDANTGHHVWAERYDRDLHDIFQLQDEITEAIVASMHPELSYFETKQAGRKDPKNVDAWESFHHAIWHFYHLTKEHNIKARQYFERAIQLDSEFSPAYSGMARTHQYDITNQWTESAPDSLSKSFEAAQRATTLDPEDPLGHISLAFAYGLIGERDSAISSARLAVELNPSFADGHANLALHLTLGGQYDSAMESIETSLNLSPKDPEIFLRLSIAGIAHVGAGNYEEAINFANQSLQRRPDWNFSHAILIVSYAYLDQIEKAEAALGELIKVEPNFSSEGFRMLNPTQELLNRFLKGFELAGFTE